MEPPQTNTYTRTHILQNEVCKYRPGRGEHRSHYSTSIQLALTIPRFLQKRLEREGFPRSEISLGALAIFLFLLVCFCRRSLRMRVERPTGPPPRAS